MDLQSDRYWECRIEGVAEPFKACGSIREIMPRLAVWLHSQRNGDFTVRAGRNPLTDSPALTPEIAAESYPDPDPTDDWQSYYIRLVSHFQGGEDMAHYLANEAFGLPQNPWLGDEKVLRFIHMNASDRLYERADPDEYAWLHQYVDKTYPAFAATMTIRGQKRLEK